MTHNHANLCAAQCHRSKSDAADQRVLVKAHRKLKDSGYQSLDELTCYVVDGEITIRGSVQSFYLKQVAQTLVASIDEHVIVNNLVEVTRQPISKKSAIPEGRE